MGWLHHKPPPFAACFVVLITIVSIKETESRSIYNKCGTENHFCMGSSSLSRDTSSTKNAVGNEGCLGTHDCVVIVHGEKFRNGEVTWDIATIPDSWIYVLFVKGALNVNSNNIPQDVHMMEVVHGNVCFTN